MNYTEKEAKEKWCPMVHKRSLKTTYTYKDGSEGDIRQDFIANKETCIASECMMWQFNFECEWCRNRGRSVPETRQGYCGLGGKS